MNLKKYRITFEPTLLQETGARPAIYSHNRREFFQNIIKYLLRLRENGDIKDDTFDYFVKKITAEFIEIELSERINKILKNKTLFNHLGELF